MKRRVFACSDLHGRLDLYNEICKFLTTEDTVYFLGDAGDRGPDSWATIKAIAANKNWIYLKGNHEDMLVRTAREFLHYGTCYSNFQLLAHNGGKDTFFDLMKEENVKDWISFLDRLPVSMTYLNKNNQTICLTHAGYTPKHTLDPIYFQDLLWDRSHFWDEWSDDEKLKNTIMVHGHTPILYMLGDFSDIPQTTESFWYCDNHKVNIDNGAVWTGKVILLDLDTFEEHIIEIKEKE